MTTSKVILISGASRGIGLACAMHLAQAGHQVFGTSRNVQPAKEDGTNLPFTMLPLDVCCDDGVEQAVHSVLQQCGCIDVLINNAGYGVIGTEEMVSIAQAQALFDANFFGAMRLIQAVLPTMRAQQAGHIINISSLSGFHPNPLLSIYAAAKFALEGMALALATNLRPWNIAVSLVEPGPAQSGFAQHAEMGDRFAAPENPYANYIDANLARWQQRVQEGEEPSVIAELIARILQEAKPDFRYCSSPLVQGKAQQVFVDPSGNSQLASLIQDYHR